MMEHVFCAFLGEPPREDFIPYVADFYLQLENVQWTVISGVVNDTFVVSVRNLGYSRNAGDFVRRWFNDIGSAGGHRTMAKAVVPLEAFQQQVRHATKAAASTSGMLELVLEFLHETQRQDSTASSLKHGVARPALSPSACSRSSIRSAASSRPIDKPHHPLRHAGRRQLLVAQPVLRGEHRQAADALDAAEAGGALDDLQRSKTRNAAVLAALQVDRRPCRRSRTSGRAAIAWSGCDARPG